MAQLWGGRFTKETDQLVYNFNASISFDKKFYRQDMEGSIAHVKMLGKQGILTGQETEALITAVKDLLDEIEAGTLEISHEYEDIHSFVEADSNSFSDKYPASSDGRASSFQNTLPDDGPTSQAALSVNV